MPHSTRHILAAALLVLSIPTAPLTAGDLVVSGSLVSTVVTGTPPLTVSSTTKVDGLNADLLDGLDASDLFTTATDGAGSGLDADLLDGLEASALARSLGNVALVGTTGGDFTSIQAALDSITTASAANPFLVLVGPGVYDERVVMKPFVDIQGAGEGVTRITQSGGSGAQLGTVAGADDAELRFLTVENSGGSSFVVGVHNNGTSPRLLHVTVEVDSTAETTVWGIHSTQSPNPSSPQFLHVTVVAEGTGFTYGVLNSNGVETRMKSVRVQVGGSGVGDKVGIANSAAEPVLDDVEIIATSEGTEADVYGLLNQDVSEALIRDVRVAVSGGDLQFGVYNLRSSLLLRDLEVGLSADGAGGIGVLNEDSTVVLESCSVTVDGSNALAAVWYWESSGELRDCTAEAAGAGDRIAVAGGGTGSTSPHVVEVHHSRLRGESVIDGGTNYTFRVGASQLDGTVDPDPASNCVSSYDGSFVALPANCM